MGNPVAVESAIIRLAGVTLAALSTMKR